MPAEAIHLERLLQRRIRDLDASTRAEILLSIGAALLFVAVLSWRLPPSQYRVLEFTLPAVLIWSAFLVYRLRAVIWTPPADLAATGLAHYRRVLERRRDHLKNAWLWHGPMLLASLSLSVALYKLSEGRLRNMMPFFALLILWGILGLVMRRRKAAELQREIDEISPPAT